MTLVDLTQFIMRLNGAIDTGRHLDISVAEIEHHVANADLLSFLEGRLGRDIDLTWLDYTRRVDLNQKFEANFRGLEPGTWGIANSGLCLLVAWTNELLGRHDWEEQ